MNMKTMLRLAAMVLALACAASPLQATDRPITVDDIVKLEAFGRATIAPDGRWAVYEKRDDYDTIPNYDHMQRAHLTIMDYAVLTPAMPFDQPGSRTPAFFEDSVDLAVDAAFAAHPELPQHRTAYYGHSMGGYIGLIVASRSDRYQSYILSSAASDVFGNWGEFVPATRIMPDDGRMMRNQQGWVETGQGEVGATPWGDPAKLVEESPWLKADQVRNPVLLIAADRDFVSMTQAERTFSALARLGKKTRLATYWGEYHVRWSPANIRDQYDLIVKWLEETLPPEPDAGTAAAKGQGVAPTP